MKKIILASSSKYRKELLERLAMPFDCIPSDIDESPYKKEISSPELLAQKLSFLKAQDVFNKNKDAIVIGSDQVCYLDTKIFSKSGSFEKSIEILKQLRGKEHKLATAYTIISTDFKISHTNITTLKMKNLSDMSIKKYLELDTPYDCAGSYKLELKGISLFDNIQTEDHSAIIGLPLIQLSKDLESFGVYTWEKI